MIDDDNGMEYAPMTWPTQQDIDERLELFAAKDRIEKLESLAEWCKPDEHSPIGHWEAYRACFPDSGGAGE